MATKVDMTCVMIDEGHCLLDSGEDFLPEFHLNSHVRSLFSSPLRMFTSTATASKEVEVALAHCLGMTEFKILFTFPVINDKITLNVFKRIPATGGNNEVR